MSAADFLDELLGLVAAAEPPAEAGKRGVEGHALPPRHDCAGESRRMRKTCWPSQARAVAAAMLNFQYGSTAET